MGVVWNIIKNNVNNFNKVNLDYKGALSALLQSLNVVAKVVIGYRYHMDPFNKNFAHFYQMKCLV
jgi:hypothetical protein